MTFELKVEQSRHAILTEVAGSTDVTFFRSWGNIGDDLIYAGARQLLAQSRYREVSVLELEQTSGHTALLCGSGAWCGVYNTLYRYLPAIEERFERVIVLPSSFDPQISEVKQTLERSAAIVFAREEASFEHIRPLCDARLAHDTAFFYDFTPFRRDGEGILNAYRTDGESALGALPADNVDISVTCATLDEWLWTIARHETIYTDRAHVIIGAALLGKRVNYWGNSYHKVDGIVEYALRSFPVDRVAVDVGRTGSSTPSGMRESDSRGQMWFEQIMAASQDLIHLMLEHQPIVLIDDDQIRSRMVSELRLVPITEHENQYSGAPADSTTAIEGLEQRRSEGAQWLVIAWPSFWWLDHYDDFRTHVESRYPRRLSNERLLAFDLR